jgi:anti-sigma factor RsiW
MSALPVANACASLEKALEAYVDGELDASGVLAVDMHLEGCARCSERISLRRAMKRAVRDHARGEVASAALRARIAASAARLPNAPARMGQAGPSASSGSTRPSWKSAIPWAAAASLALMLSGGSRWLYRSPAAAVEAGRATMQAGARAEALEDLALFHARPLPPEELDPQRVQTVFSPIVGVPVRPMRFETPAARSYTFAGARLMPMQEESAATLFYDVNGTRVTVFVFDPSRIRVQSSCCLAPHVVSVGGQERTIMLGRAKGYTVALEERDGVGYALSADLSEDDMLRLAAGM